MAMAKTITRSAKRRRKVLMLGVGVLAVASAAGIVLGIVEKYQEAADRAH